MSVQLPYAAAPLLPMPLLQAGAATMPTASSGLSAPTGMLSGASAAVPVPALDTVPVPRLQAGQVLRGCPTLRPLRCHVMLLRGLAAGRLAWCNLTIIMHDVYAHLCEFFRSV